MKAHRQPVVLSNKRLKIEGIDRRGEMLLRCRCGFRFLASLPAHRVCCHRCGNRAEVT